MAARTYHFKSANLAGRLSLLIQPRTSPNAQRQTGLCVAAFSLCFVDAAA